MCECTVCYSTPGKVTCPYCTYCTCIPCQKQYLTSTIKDAHCMNCHTMWDRQVLKDIFPAAFVNQTLKMHREQVLFEREKSFFPSTQKFAKLEKCKRELLQIEKESAQQPYRLRELTNTDLASIHDIIFKINFFQHTRIHNQKNSYYPWIIV